MKNLKLSIALMLAFLFVFNNCKKDEIITEPIPETEDPQFQEGMIQLGERLDNPYTVENMRKAYQYLKAESQFISASIDGSEIKVTHLYVRFLPKSFDELAILQNDTTLELFDYPLDYEIKEGGTYYQDPELPDKSITWQYCAVEKDFIFPNIEYEIIAELFLPESIEEAENKKSSEDWTYWDDLEIMALKITGNYDEEDSDLKSTMGRTKWKPSGTIRVYDDSGLGWIPVVGCKVRAMSWFLFKSDLTNSNGYFYINHDFKGYVNYSIKWEREDFDIRSGNWGQAYYTGPRYKEQAWNLDIYKRNISWVHAHVHRGAYRYWYNNVYGIKTPPKNSFWKRKIQIGVKNASMLQLLGLREYCLPFVRWATFPEIKIFGKNSENNYHSSQRIYESTIHELVHTSHWDLDRGAFYTAGGLVRESWAIGVQYVFATDVYGNLHFANMNEVDFDVIRTKFKGKYTPLVIDLMDNENQRAIYGNSTDYPIDRVTGFSIGQIEKALKNTNSPTEWRDNLKSLYNISTDAYIDELFDNYINL